MRFRRRNLEAIGDLICGNLGSAEPISDAEPKYFPYRSSMYITEFFQELDTDWTHDGSTRHRWVADVLESMLAEPHDGPAHPPEVFCRLIDHLMSSGDAMNEGPDRPNALRQLNDVLAREGFEAFYAEDKHCYLRHVGTSTVTVLGANPHRPLTAAEVTRASQLGGLPRQLQRGRADRGSLLPLFRQLGFHRSLPLAKGQGAGVRQGHLDALHAADPAHPLFRHPGEKRKDRFVRNDRGNANVAEIHHQALMMLAHEIFDPRPTGVSWWTTRSSWPAERSPRRRGTGSAIARRLQAQSDHVHGSRRHSQSVCGDESAAACGGLAVIGEPVDPGRERSSL